MHRIESLLKKSIPNDHSAQVSSGYYLDYLFAQGKSIRNVLDLGCGTGHSQEHFWEIDKDINWVGIEIEALPEVLLNGRTDGAIQLYDGVHMPFEDNSFDLIYCNQVLEHVRYPAVVLSEVYRILKPGGYFVGSTSQLEPYHSYSTWNYTPYGFSLLVEEEGLQLVEIRPSIDSVTLIIRRGLGRPKFFMRWWQQESPLNSTIGLLGKMIGKEAAWINAMKLLFCGQFAFLVYKPTAK